MIHAYLPWLRFRTSRALRRARACATSRYRRTRGLPGNLLIIVAPPRSGSTWLFDLLKSVPGARVHRTFDIFAALRLVGRRYPVDCTVQEPPCERVETEPGLFEGLPLYVDEEQATGPSPTNWYVEKCHPHFYSYNARAFSKSLRRFRPDWSIRTIYHVRKPRSVFASFFSYQLRNPNWNRGITPLLAGRHLLANYRSLKELSERVPGTVMDYDELRSQPVRALHRLLAAIGTYEDMAMPAPSYLASLVRRSTWEARSATGTLFVGDHEGTNSSFVDGIAAAMERTQDELKECEAVYSELMGPCVSWS